MFNLILYIMISFISNLDLFKVVRLIGVTFVLITLLAVIFFGDWSTINRAF